MVKYFLLLFFLHEILYAQTSSRMGVVYILGQEKAVSKNLSSCKDSICYNNTAIEYIQNTLWPNGYFTAHIDSIKVDSNKNVYNVYINPGNAFSWIELKEGNMDPKIIKTLKINLTEKQQSVFNPFELIFLQKTIIKYYENKGYPFASIQLDSISLLREGIKANLNVQLNEYIVIDSIQFSGEIKLNKTYTYQYLEIFPGMPYSESKLRAIESKINEWSFAGIKKSPYAIFTKGNASIFIELIKKKSSNFNGIIGVLPNNEGNISVVGEMRLRLDNSFGRAEQFQMMWKRLQNNTQNINIKTSFPYVLNTNLGLGADFDLFRRDTSFNNLNAKLFIQYLFNPKNYLEFFYNIKRSNIIGNSIVNTGNLSFLDVSSNAYGMGVKFDRLDYAINPTKGYLMQAALSAGNKNIRNNPLLPNEVYQNIDTKTIEVLSQWQFQYYMLLHKRIVLKLKLTDQRLLSKNKFENEFYRIGGLFSLRGFDEESIYNSANTIFTMEPRFILEKNSFLYVFFDGAYYEYNTLSRFIYGYPFGYGAGISFETKPGIFTFSYALGRHTFSENGISKDAGFSLRSGKVHFGYISYF